MKLRKRITAQDSRYERAEKTLLDRIALHADFEPVGRATAVQKRIGGSTAWLLTAHVEKEIAL